MMKKVDIPGIVGLMLSVFIMEESWRMPVQGVVGRTTFAPWPGFLPFWVGLVMAILSILLIISTARESGDPKKKATFPRGQALIAILLFTVSMVAYIALLDVLGYLVDTLLLNIFLMRVVMRAQWKLSLWVPVVASVSLYVIFQVMLGVNLPRNMFGF
jgi:putative tricarboxylic transport membrane protein